MNAAEARTRANAAQVELRIHGEAIDALRADMLRRWLETEITDTAGRETLWHRVKALDEVRRLIMSDIDAATVLDARDRIRDNLKTSTR